MASGRLMIRKASPARTVLRLCAALAGFAVLLFVARFLARAHLVFHTDEMCHIGAIAVDVLAHGVRFPLLAYAPVEYNNGSFFSGLLAAVSFSAFGRNVLVLKLVTHLLSAAGAVAALALLRGCLNEIGLTSRWPRRAATAALVIAIALAPRLVTGEATATIGFASPAEGAPMNTLLLALFAQRLHARSMLRTAAFWALAGFALYLSKGTILVIPVLGAAEIALAWPSWGRLVAAASGLLLGLLPELPLFAQRRLTGWEFIASTAQRNVHQFPSAFFDSVLTLADDRIELVGAWTLAVGLGGMWLVRTGMRFCRGGWRVAQPGGCDEPRVEGPPVALCVVVGVSCLHLMALMVMAQGGIDPYAIYGYPTLVVLFSVLVATVCARAGAARGESVAASVSVVAIAVTLILYRPDALTWGGPALSALWRNRAAAACSWHLAEGFIREHQYGLVPPGRTPEQHAIERCRSLSEDALILDCVGGIARTLHVRDRGKVESEPPTALSATERRAYAFYYGIHRLGDTAPCRDFASPDLARDCVTLVQLECLLFGDINTRFFSGRALGRPRCVIPEPPMDGYWAALRSDLFSRPTGSGPYLARMVGGLAGCKPVFDACY